MSGITSLTISTVGAALLAMVASLAPSQAAILDLNFITEDRIFGEVRKSSGSFRLNTETKQVSNLGGILRLIEGESLVDPNFRVSRQGSDTVLTYKALYCSEAEGDPDTGEFLYCRQQGSLDVRLRLEFQGEALFNQLSNVPSVYENSFLPGSSRANNDLSFGEVVGSSLIQTYFETDFPYAITALQVERVDVPVETVPEPATTTATLIFATLGTGLFFKRKRQLTVG
jgi:hypothetical protein